MSTRTVRECDRCRREIKAAANIVRIQSGTRPGDHELCSGCSTELAKFMAGEKLEVPP